MPEDKIRHALVELLYRNAWGVVASNVATSAAVVFVLWKAVDTEFLRIWFGLVCLLSLARGCVAFYFARRGRDAWSTAAWAWLATAFSCMSGLLWGSLGWVGFMPGDPLVFSFTMVALTGIVGGTVPSLSAFPPALVLSVLATSVPLALRCIQSGSEITGPFLFLIVAFVTINFYYCRSTHRMLREAIALRLENERLAETIAAERDRAQSANQSKTRFLAAASHDLRQPIHALSLLVTTLALRGRRGNVPSGEAVDLAARARSLVGNLSGLLNALLDISKLDAGIVTVDREAIDLGQLFEQLKGDFAMEAHQRGLAWRVIGRDVHVDSDPMMLRRILDNLLSNAFRYTRTGGVLLGARKRGDAIEIQVWDTGLGIPREQQQLVYEEFLQLHNPERDRSQGLGLGLAIVKRTAALLGHSVKLRSIPDRGSMFSITVPIAAGAGPSGLVPPIVGDRLSLGIVVIDDERDALDAVAGLLRIDGHRVYDGDAARTVESRHRISATAKPVDLIIADYRLRDNVTGLEAIRDIRRYVGREIPAVVITGDTSPARLAEVAASGIQLLHKPVDGEELLALVQRLGTPRGA